MRNHGGGGELGLQHELIEIVDIVEKVVAGATNPFGIAMPRQVGGLDVLVGRKAAGERIPCMAMIVDPMD